MTTLRLTDLDEIVLQIREAGARSYIAEAVAAYRAGAYRSAIISTWILCWEIYKNNLKLG